MKPTPLTSEEQQARFGQVAARRKPLQGDMLSGEFKVGKPKSGNGRHVILRRAPGEPVVTPGMAHFAGTGPERKYCKDCVHCQELSVYRGGRMLPPSTRPGEEVVLPLRFERDACAKAASMMDDMVQRGGIGANRACKYFEGRT